VKNISIAPLGDHALCVTFGNAISVDLSNTIRSYSQVIADARLTGVGEVVPTYCTMMICYDPLQIGYGTLSEKIRALLKQPLPSAEIDLTRRVHIPVCYGGKFGPDLSFVAQHTGLTEEEVISRHAGRDYPIFMLGFLPGFPYLGDLDSALNTPRLSSPRIRIAPGSVGIGGEQTGIYPIASPGGWRLIGRTPIKLFDPKRTPATPYVAGNRIRFDPISELEYNAIFEQGSDYQLWIEDGV